MPGRRGARSGRGWDAIPPRPADESPPPGGEPPDGDQERGNVPGRRRGSPGNFSPAIGGSGTTGGYGRRSGSSRRGARGSGDPAGVDGLPGAGHGPGDLGDPAGTGGGQAARGGPGGLFDDPADHAGRRGSAGRPGSRGRGGGDSRPPEPPRSESEVAREICLNQLAVRPRTRAELAKVLTRKEISAEVIAEVLDRYDEVGIIDDAAFARAWVSTRHQGRGLARRALADELRRHGVDAEVASEALETVDDESEAATARALVDRKLRTAHGPPDALFRRLVGMLARKGYPAGIAIPAVKDALAARDAEAAEFADQLDADALADE